MSLPHDDCVDCGHSPSLIVPVSQVPGNYSYTLKDTDNPRSKPQISQMLRVFRMAIIKKIYKQYTLERVWRKGNPFTQIVGM